MTSDTQINDKEYKHFLLNLQDICKTEFGMKHFSDMLDEIEQGIINVKASDFFKNNTCSFENVKTLDGINKIDAYYGEGFKFLGIDNDVIAYVVNGYVLRFSIILYLVNSCVIFNLLNAFKTKYGNPSNCFHIPDMADIRRMMLENEKNIIAFKENNIHIQFGTIEKTMYASIVFDSCLYENILIINKKMKLINEKIGFAFN